MNDKNKDVKVEPKVVTKPVRKPSAFELERIAARQRTSEANVLQYLLSRD